MRVRNLGCYMNQIWLGQSSWWIEDLDQRICLLFEPMKVRSMSTKMFKYTRIEALTTLCSLLTVINITRQSIKPLNMFWYTCLKCTWIYEMKLFCLQGILGHVQSGKSALVHRYLTGSYMQEESPEGNNFRIVKTMNSQTLKYKEHPAYFLVSRLKVRETFTGEIFLRTSLTFYF